MRCKWYGWNKKWWNAKGEWNASDMNNFFVHWCQRGSEIRSDEISVFTWTLCISRHCILIHFIYLFYMYASGNHVIYFIYELYHALEPLVCNRIELCWLANLCSLKLLMVHEFLDDEDIIFEKWYSMDIWKSFASSHSYRQGSLFPLLKIVVHSLLLIKSSICTHLGGALSCFECW
jgi:hypothetical protein